MRLVVLDTETTGMDRGRHGDVCRGHRIIEIGCVEILDGHVTGKSFHSYINPGCKVDPKAVVVHGITDDMLVGKPTFEDVVEGFLCFIGDSEIVIHNAVFDIAFLNKEFRLLGAGKRPTGSFFFIDTLRLARELYPGVPNTLDALAIRYGIERIGLHGALVDAQLLALIFLLMS